MFAPRVQALDTLAVFVPSALLSPAIPHHKNHILHRRASSRKPA